MKEELLRPAVLMGQIMCVQVAFRHSFQLHESLIILLSSSFVSFPAFCSCISEPLQEFCQYVLKTNQAQFVAVCCSVTYSQIVGNYC